MDSGSLITPPSPPMQMSPFDALSDNYDTKSGINSPHMNIEVPVMSGGRSTYPLSSCHNVNIDEADKSGVDMKSNDAYVQSYSSLLSNHTVGNNKVQEWPFIPLTREDVINSLDLSSEAGSCSSVHNSVTSHDLAINLLDAAIADSSSPEKTTPRFTNTILTNNSTFSVKNTPKKSESISSRKSSGSDTSARDKLARTVAEAIIAKLVKMHG